MCVAGSHPGYVPRLRIRLFEEFNPMLRVRNAHFIYLELLILGNGRLYTIPLHALHDLIYFFFRTIS